MVSLPAKARHGPHRPCRRKERRIIRHSNGGGGVCTAPKLTPLQPRAVEQKPKQARRGSSNQRQARAQDKQKACESRDQPRRANTVSRPESSPCGEGHDGRCANWCNRTLSRLWVEGTLPEPARCPGLSNPSPSFSPSGSSPWDASSSGYLERQRAHRSSGGSRLVPCRSTSATHHSGIVATVRSAVSGHSLVNCG